MPVREIKALKFGDENLKVAPNAVNFFDTEEEDFYEQFEEGTLKDGFHTVDVFGLKKVLVDDSGDAFAMTSNDTYIVSSHFKDTGVVIKFRNIATNETTEKVLNNFKNKTNAPVNAIGIVFKWNSNKTILYILYTYLGQSSVETNPRRDILYSFDVSNLTNSFVTVQTFTNQTNAQASFGPSMPAHLIEGANDSYIIGSYNNGLNNASSFLFVYSFKTNTFYYNVSGASAGAGRNQKQLLGEENKNTPLDSQGVNITKVLTKTIDNVTYDFLQIYNETLIVKPDNTFVKLANTIYTGLGKKFIAIPTSDQSGTDTIYFASTHTYIIKEYDFTTGTFNEALNQNMTLNGTIRQFVVDARPNATLLISYRYSGGNQQFNYYSIKLESGNISVVNTLLAPAIRYGGMSSFFHNYFGGKFLNQNSVIYRIEEDLTATKIYDFFPSAFSANAYITAKGTTKTGLNYFLFSTYADGTSGKTVQVMLAGENNITLLSSKANLSAITDSASTEYLQRALLKPSLGFTAATYNFISTTNNTTYYDNFENVDTFEFANETYVRNTLGTSKGSRTFVGERENLIKQGERIFYINEDYKIIELKNETVMIRVKGQLVKNNFIITQNL